MEMQKEEKGSALIYVEVLYKLQAAVWGQLADAAVLQIY